MIHKILCFLGLHKYEIKSTEVCATYHKSEYVCKYCKKIKTIVEDN